MRNKSFLKFIRFSIYCFLLLSILAASCNGESKDDEKKYNIQSFYYPVESLKSPLVYEYQPINNDTFGVQYYYFSTLETDTATYFTSNIYNQFFQVEQFSIEELVTNGMLQKEYFLYDFDSTGNQIRYPAAIEYDNAFPFEVRDSGGIFLQKMKWTFNEEPLHTTTLIRNRRYIGMSSYTYRGKTYEAVTFGVKEILDDFYDGHLETKTNGIEIYAKGLGLVYFKKTIGNALTMEYELKDTYTMEVLEGKFSKTLNQ